MTFQTIYVKDIAAKQEEENAVILDVRSREEYWEEHWPGAVSYPYNGEDDWGSRLPMNRTFILYCGHGGSSMQAARKLGLKGFRVYTVIGGYEIMKKIQENYFKY